MKHTLVVIGFTGIRRAYLDIPRATAVERYVAEEGEVITAGKGVPVDEFEFEDEFMCYDAWSKADGD